MKPQNYKSNTILIQWIESFNTATYTGCYIFNLSAGKIEILYTSNKNAGIVEE